MDFFRSVFADEPDSPKSDPESNSPTKHASQSDHDPSSPQIPNAPNDGAGGGWSFGGLFKSISTTSESVLETYRRDLKEFGSGLKKEIEVAQGSLGNVTHAIDEIGNSVLKSTAQIISQGKEAILTDGHESDSSDNNYDRNLSSQQSLNSKPYSRFEAQVRAIQCDANTYCEEAEDYDDYVKWKSGFVLDEKREEMETLLEENGPVESIYKKVVPSAVDEETFWSRYYYRVFKLKQAEDVRANIVKRAISRDEEELSWDVDEDEEEEKEMDSKRNVAVAEASKEAAKGIKEINREDSVQNVDESVHKEVENREIEVNVEKKEESSVEESKGVKVSSGGDNAVSEKAELEKTSSKVDEESSLEGNDGNGETSKDSDVSVVSSHPSIAGEEDLGWDEIEDLSSIDDRRVSQTASPSKIDLRKRLSAAEEDEEDLSWDIEDDDEPVKA